MLNFEVMRRLAKCGILDVPVQNNLAVTPSEMWKLQQQGLPISAQASGLAYDDGNYGVSWDVPFEHRRGVDIAQAFEYEQHLQKGIEKLLPHLNQKPSDSQ